MSLASWMEEFYQDDAYEVPKDKALEHSLRKWEGLLPENRAKHGLTLQEDVLEGVEGEFFQLGSETCALCVQYADDGCEGCPLEEVREGYSCDSFRHDEKESPYFEFVDSGNAEPMLTWLRAAEKNTKPEEAGAIVKELVQRDNDETAAILEALKGFSDEDLRAELQRRRANNER